jgi:hypothetical protein
MMGRNPMIKFTVSIVMTILMAGICLADDPGERDSVIVETVFANLGDSTIDVRIYATTDDSVFFYNFPITWNLSGGAGIFPINVTYYNTLIYWMDTYDTLLYDQILLRMLGWVDGHGEPPLFTNNQRTHCWTIHFVVDSLTLPQIVGIDTTFDPVNGSLLFALGDGITSFTPEFTLGAIYYGILSENYEIISNLSKESGLLQNYPNPFNSSTTIEFGLPEAGRVRIDIYDLLGRRIETLVDEEKRAGQHRIVWDASGHSSGVYFYRIEAGDFVETKRMVYLK